MAPLSLAYNFVFDNFLQKILQSNEYCWQYIWLSSGRYRRELEVWPRILKTILEAKIWTHLPHEKLATLDWGLISEGVATEAAANEAAANEAVEISRV